MKRFLLIGAGQLGSRHLQGALKAETPLDITVVDPNETSLVTARLRADELPAEHHRLTFLTELTPGAWDVVLVSTSAHVRSAVIRKLLDLGIRPSYLILEKVLFQTIAELDAVERLLDEAGIPTWVNHPRRSFSHYQKIRETLNGEPASLTMSGGEWGLACNGLHFLDVAGFLNTSALSSLDTTHLLPGAVDSKRNGFKEVLGTLTGRFQNGAEVVLRSEAGITDPNRIQLHSNSHRWTILEAATTRIQHDYQTSHGWKTEEEEVTMLFQSQLTGTLLDDLFRTGNCELTTYAEAAATHRVFLAGIIEHLNRTTDRVWNHCPIT